MIFPPSSCSTGTDSPV
ncbi:hypothetical protein D018_3854A, partial [Vibrio parahaemolyticus VP2007-007]